MIRVDNKKRSLIKSLSYRVFATLTTIVLVYAFTGALKLAITVGFLEVILKMLVYYGHERIWDKIRSGRK